jgi:sulfite reductase alpha subunit-like flavoprotein
MARYSKKIIDEAKYRWIKGEAIMSIARDPNMPASERTLNRWKERYNWGEELDEIYQKAWEKQKTELEQAIQQMNETHVTLSRAFLANVTHRLQQRDENGKPIYLESDELERLSRVLERVAKVERVARALPSDRQQVEGKVEADISDAWKEFLKNARSG